MARDAGEKFVATLSAVGAQRAQRGMRMRAVRYHEFGGPEKLQIEQIPQPELDGENVLIQITRAAW